MNKTIIALATTALLLLGAVFIIDKSPLQSNSVSYGEFALCILDVGASIDEQEKTLSSVEFALLKYYAGLILGTSPNSPAECLAFHQFIAENEESHNYSIDVNHDNIALNCFNSAISLKYANQYQLTQQLYKQLMACSGN